MYVVLRPFGSYISHWQASLEKKGFIYLITFTDYKTDTVIQTTLRNELPSDVTVITVAHRLQTIMDADKIVSHWEICCRHVLNSACVDGSG